MRGGKRRRIAPVTGQQALIDAIWHSLGGVGRVAQLLGCGSQIPINYRNRKGVPLVVVQEIAEALRISPWGLNYEDMCRFHCGRKCPSWKEVVNSYGLARSVMMSIMALPSPGEHK